MVDGACGVLSGVCRLEPFVMSKMSKVLVDIGKMAWPQQYPSMFEDVRSLCMSPTTYTLGLSLLSMIGIEFVSPAYYTTSPSAALLAVLF